MRTSVDVHNFLLERDVPHELVPIGRRLKAPHRVAAVLGLPPEQVGRVVVLAAGDRLIAVLVPAGAEPDLRRVASAARAHGVEELPPDRISELTDFLAEAVPPVGLPNGTKVLIDGQLADQEVLYFAGGETSTLLKIRPEDLVRASHAKVANIAR